MVSKGQKKLSKIYFSIVFTNKNRVDPSEIRVKKTLRSKVKRSNIARNLGREGLIIFEELYRKFFFS